MVDIYTDAINRAAKEFVARLDNVAIDGFAPSSGSYEDVAVEALKRAAETSIVSKGLARCLANAPKVALDFHALEGQGVLNRYEIGPLLGDGATSTCYLGRDTVDDRDVTLKFIHSMPQDWSQSTQGDLACAYRTVMGRARGGKQSWDFSAYRNVADFAAQEFNILRRFQSEYLPHAIDLRVFPHAALLILEHVPGESLDRYARIEALRDEKFFARVLIEVLTLLDGLHGLGLLHGNVKPCNVLNDRGRYRLIDFGAARELHTLSQTLSYEGIVFGTLRFAAPELFFLNGPIDARSDLFSAFMTVAGLISPRCPLQVDLPSRRAIIDTSTLNHFGFSKPFVELFAKGLAVNPAERYQTARHAIEVVSEFL